jgi:phosphoglycerate dehydrogenase-like enzyme
MEIMVDGIYGGGRRERLAELTNLYPDVINDKNFDEHVDRLADIDAIFSSWGMPELNEERLEKLPRLKAVFYAGGSVKAFAPRLFDRDIHVIGAWSLNAIPVAEYLLGTLLLANKGFFHREPRREQVGEHSWPAGHGNFERTVGLLGMGQSGRHLRELLRTIGVEVIVYDPTLDPEGAQALDVQNVSLEELFERAVFVSNQIPQLPNTRDLVHGGLLRRLQTDATFVSIANGHSLAWKDLYGVFSDRVDLTGIFDTIEGAYETMTADEVDALRSLPNVHASAHIAGALGWERRRMADGLIEDFLRWEAGQPLQYAITADMLTKMA